MRKLLAICSMALLPLFALAAGPSFGHHGMALFGGSEGLYASHLPMFHAPHDAQVILRLRVADPVIDLAVRRRLDGKTALWTLSPEKFELAQFAPGSTAPYPAFRADLVLGHFEQGGTTQYTNVKMVVEKVLYYRKLSTQLAVRATTRYLHIGDGKQRFLVKQIDSRPDFDHIVAIKAGSKPPRSPLVIPKHGLREPGPAAVTRDLPEATIVGSIYFNTSDLK